MRNLTELQRRFVNAWVAGGLTNATAAARVAGYKGTTQSLGATAYKLLTLAHIQAAISDRVGKAIQKADRGAIADLTESLAFATTVMRTRLGDYLTEQGDVDVKKIREAPAGVLKKLRVSTTTDEDGQVFTRTDIEAESALSAAQTLIKHYDGSDGEKRPEGLLAQVLAQLPPETIATIARAMLSGQPRRLPIDVEGKVLSR